MNNPTITGDRLCTKCVYWQPVEGEQGECRRHAPQTIALHVDEGVQFESRFPETMADDWCGDFFAK